MPCPHAQRSTGHMHSTPHASSPLVSQQTSALVRTHPVMEGYAYDAQYGKTKRRKETHGAIRRFIYGSLRWAESSLGKANQYGTNELSY